MALELYRTLTEMAFVNLCSHKDNVRKFGVSFY
jgi:hypothetical protein